MSIREFCEWAAYCELFGPVDYQRRYDRPAVLTAFPHSKATVKDWFEMLHSMNFNPHQKDLSHLRDADQSVARAFGKVK